MSTLIYDSGISMKIINEENHMDRLRNLVVLDIVRLLEF
jgi:hypothetical protein